jgi:hypothetical protein
MTDLELALKELESATAAVAKLPEDDYAETRAAVDRCAWALRDLAALAAKLPPADRERAIDRLRGAVTP